MHYLTAGKEIKNTLAFFNMLFCAKVRKKGRKGGRREGRREGGRKKRVIE